MNFVLILLLLLLLLWHYFINGMHAEHSETSWAQKPTSQTCATLSILSDNNAPVFATT